MEEIKTESEPDWARFLAQDGDGVWYWHASKPKPNGVTVSGKGYWLSTGESCVACRGEVLGDWRDTLEKRPEQNEFEPFVSVEDSQEKEMKQGNGWFERGELPPVGSNVTIVEIDGLGISDLGREFIGDECKVMATFVRPAVFHGDEAKIVAVMEPAGGCCCFRLEMVKPIRTERDLAIELMQSDIAERWANCEELARHLVDKGWVKGGK